MYLFAVCLLICLFCSYCFICLFVCSFVRLFVWLVGWLFGCLVVVLCVCVCVCLRGLLVVWLFWLFVCLSVCLFVCLLVCLFESITFSPSEEAAGFADMATAKAREFTTCTYEPVASVQPKNPNQVLTNQSVNNLKPSVFLAPDAQF